MWMPIMSFDNRLVLLCLGNQLCVGSAVGGQTEHFWTWWSVFGWLCHHWKTLDGTRDVVGRGADAKRHTGAWPPSQPWTIWMNHNRERRSIRIDLQKWLFCCTWWAADRVSRQNWTMTRVFFWWKIHKRFDRYFTKKMPSILVRSRCSPVEKVSLHNKWKGLFSIVLLRTRKLNC